MDDTAPTVADVRAEVINLVRAAATKAIEDDSGVGGFVDLLAATGRLDLSVWVDETDRLRERRDMLAAALAEEPAATADTSAKSWADVADIMAEEPLHPGDAAWLMSWVAAAGREKNDDNRTRRLVGRLLSEREALRREVIADGRALAARDAEVDRLAGVIEQLRALATSAEKHGVPIQPEDVYGILGPSPTDGSTD